MVTDSSASLPPDLVASSGIRVAPQWVVIDGTPYRDGEIECSVLWERMRLDSRVTTAQPTREDLINIFNTVAASAKKILMVTVASRLSSTFHTACLAAGEAGVDDIVVVDSRTALGGLGLVTLAAAEAAMNREDLAGAMGRANEAIGRVRLFAILETMRYAARSGRAPILASYLGSAIRLYPVLELQQGKAHVRGLARSMEGAMERLRRLILRAVQPPWRAGLITHSNCPERAHWLAERLRRAYDPGNLHISPVPASACVHMGPGAVTAAVLPG